MHATTVYAFLIPHLLIRKKSLSVSSILRWSIALVSDRSIMRWSIALVSASSILRWSIALVSASSILRWSIALVSSYSCVQKRSFIRVVTPVKMDLAV